MRWTSASTVRQTVKGRAFPVAGVPDPPSGIVCRTTWSPLRVCRPSVSVWKHFCSRPHCRRSPLYYSPTFSRSWSEFITWTTLKIYDWLTDLVEDHAERATATSPPCQRPCRFGGVNGPLLKQWKIPATFTLAISRRLRVSSLQFTECIMDILRRCSRWRCCGHMSRVCVCVWKKPRPGLSCQHTEINAVRHCLMEAVWGCQALAQRQIFDPGLATMALTLCGLAKPTPLATPVCRDTTRDLTFVPPPTRALSPENSYRDWLVGVEFNAPHDTI